MGDGADLLVHECFIHREMLARRGAPADQGLKNLALYHALSWEVGTAAVGAAQPKRDRARSARGGRLPSVAIRPQSSTTRPRAPGSPIRSARPPIMGGPSRKPK
jgi:hypothetical protein